MSTEKNSWVKDLLVAFAATTLSIILTFGTTGVINRIKQKQERKLTALMVMSSIESFARQLEEEEKDMALKDSVATWLLGIPIEDVIRLGDEPFERAFSAAFVTGNLNHDRTAETIFSSHIDTWKNMGNFQFIDNVGGCFSSINWMEEYYNETTLEYQTARDKIFCTLTTIRVKRWQKSICVTRTSGGKCSCPTSSGIGFVSVRLAFAGTIAETCFSSVSRKRK